MGILQTLSALPGTFTRPRVARPPCESFQVEYDGARDCRAERNLVEQAFKLHRSGKMLVPIIDDASSPQGGRSRTSRYDRFGRSRSWQCTPSTQRKTCPAHRIATTKARLSCRAVAASAKADRLPFRMRARPSTIKPYRLNSARRTTRVRRVTRTTRVRRVTTTDQHSAAHCDRNTAAVPEKRTPGTRGSVS